MKSITAVSVAFNRGRLVRVADLVVRCCSCCCGRWRIWSGHARCSLAVKKCILPLQMRALCSVAFFVSSAKIRAHETTVTTGKIAVIDLLWCI